MQKRGGENKCSTWSVLGAINCSDWLDSVRVREMGWQVWVMENHIDPAKTAAFQPERYDESLGPVVPACTGSNPFPALNLDF